MRAASALLALLAAPTAGAGPLVLRNQNPLLAPFGLPGPLPARLPSAGSGQAATTLNWASAASVDASDRHGFTLDGEFQELRLRVERGFGSRYAAVIELPWRHMGGGTLDGFIDDWHDLFGLSAGDRPKLPRDQLLIEYRRDDAPLLRMTESRAGVGDIPVSVGVQVAASDARALAAWVTLKLPLGRVDDLSGSDAVDVALSLAGQSRLAHRWQVFAQLDAVRLGRGELLPRLQKKFVWSGLAGLTWKPWRRLDLTVQLHANSAVFDVRGTNLAGNAIVLSYGGSYRSARGWRLDLGMSEDVQVGASPDVAFHFAVRRDF